MRNAFFTRERILEIAAVVFSITYTVLITYENILCWPAAIIASIIFIYLVYGKRLIAETVLHAFYLLAAVYGWIMWGTSESFQVNSYGLNINLALIAGSLALVMISGFLLKKFFSAAMPYIDSFTTIFSFIATYMMAHMVLENWLYWIVIDSVSVYMYARRGLQIGALLFAVYTVLAINGYIQWLNG
jgi:nicotinamide mononucleotide transporter